MTSLRRLRLAMWAGAVAVALAFAAYQSGILGAQSNSGSFAVTLGSHATQYSGMPLDGVPAPDFRLVDQFGRTVSLHSLRGKVVVWALVDSECTTICPLTAATIRMAQRDLGAANRDVVWLAVNANTQATSVAAVRAWSYTHGMLHHWLFLTGSPAQLKAVYRAYHVYDAVVSGQVMHDPAVFVIDPRGREELYYETSPSREVVAMGQEAQALVAGIRPYLPG